MVLLLPLYVIASVLVFAHVTSAATIYLLKDNGAGNELIELPKSNLETLYHALDKYQSHPKTLILTPKLKKILKDKLKSLPKTLELEPDPTITRYLQKLSQQSLNKHKRLQNNENLIINNPRRQPSDRYYPSSESSDNLSSKEYSNHETFQDLTRGESSERTLPVKNILDQFRNAGKDSDTDRRNSRDKTNFSTDYIDFNDLREGKDKPDSTPVSVLRFKFKIPNRRHLVTKNNPLRYVKESESDQDNEKESEHSEIEDKADSEQDMSKEDEISDEEESEEVHLSDGKEFMPKIFKSLKTTANALRKRKRPRHESEDVSENVDVPKRFEIVKKKKSKSKKTKKPVKESMEWSKEMTEEFTPSGELSEQEAKSESTNKVRHNTKETYVQAPRRLVKAGPEYEDLRKRLQQFLPKRYHWNEDELQDLGYFWFDGAQGSNPPGMWRVSY